MKYERELLLQHFNYTTFIKDNLEKVLRLTAILEKIKNHPMALWRCKE